MFLTAATICIFLSTTTTIQFIHPVCHLYPVQIVDIIQAQYIPYLDIVNPCYVFLCLRCLL